MRVYRHRDCSESLILDHHLSRDFIDFRLRCRGIPSLFQPLVTLSCRPFPSIESHGPVNGLHLVSKVLISARLSASYGEQVGLRHSLASFASSGPFM